VQPLRREEAPPIQERARTTDPQPHKNHEGLTLISEVALTAPIKLEPKQGPPPLARTLASQRETDKKAANGGEQSKIRTRSRTNVARRVPERFRDIKAEEKLSQKLPKGLQKQQSTDSQTSLKARRGHPTLGKRTGVPLQLRAHTSTIINEPVG